MTFITVNFHYVGFPEMPFPGIHGLTRTEFSETISLLKRSYTLVRPIDVLNASVDRGDLPENACLLTFDDGLACQGAVARPVLRDHGVQAAFFVPTDPYDQCRALNVHLAHYLRASVGDHTLTTKLERISASMSDFPNIRQVSVSDARAAYQYDSDETAQLKYFLVNVAPPDGLRRIFIDILEEQEVTEAEFIRLMYLKEAEIRDLATSSAIGSHCRSHRKLRLLSEQEIEDELVQSRNVLQKICESDVSLLSYPHGGPDAVSLAVAKIAERAGYKCAWTMERALNKTLSTPLLLARFDVRDVGNIGNYGFRSEYVSDA